MIFTGENIPRSFGDEYDNNIIFSELHKIMAFYDALSFCNIQTFEYTSRVSKSKFLSTTPYVYSSIGGTIESISVLLHNGRCNDAFALVRKYCDSIIIDTYKILLSKKIQERFYDSLSLDAYNDNELERWIDAEEQLYNEKEIKKVFSEIVKAYPTITKLFELNVNNTLYQKLRDICNDNMHYNYFWTIVANDAGMIQARKDFRENVLKNISKAIRTFFAIHFSLIYEGCPGYLMSSDYMDYTEMGQEPPKGSERWVSPPVQDVFNTIVKKYYPNIADYLIKLDLMDIA